MKSNRKGETGKTPPRSSRIFNMENLWYFATREGVDIGPFYSYDEALASLQEFVEFAQLANEKTMKAFSSVRSEKEDKGDLIADMDLRE